MAFALAVGKRKRWKGRFCASSSERRAFALIEEKEDCFTLDVRKKSGEKGKSGGKG